MDSPNHLAEQEAQRGSGPALPVGSAERIEILDILRGLAIFGILLVNMQFFFHPIYLEGTGQEPWPGTLDRIAAALIVFFAQGKFYALFSFLFGVGLAIQMERAEARGAPVTNFFARRMLWLLAIGLAHAWLLWYGDILALYALLGLVLLLFQRRTPRTLLVWTIVLLAVPVLLHAAIVALVEVARVLPETAGEVERAFARNRERALELTHQAREAYAHGSFGEIFRVRLGEWVRLFFFGMLNVGAELLALFLIGLNVGRRRLLRNLSSHRGAIRRWSRVFLGLGLAGSACLLLGTELGNMAEPSALSLVATIGQVLGGPALAAFYVCGVAMLLERERWHRRLAPLGHVGRMALSNYLLHSIVFTTIAYSYGLGLYGRVSPAPGLLMTFAMFVVQIPLSRWWLSRFRFGPAEWLWRSLTYRRLQPMRRGAAGPSAGGPTGSGVPPPSAAP